MPRPTPEERLNELETRYAFLERHVEALDRILVEHGGLLERLAIELRALDARRAEGPPPPSEAAS